MKKFISLFIFAISLVLNLSAQTVINGDKTVRFNIIGQFDEATSTDFTPCSRLVIITQQDNGTENGKAISLTVYEDERIVYQCSFSGKHLELVKSHAGRKVVIQDQNLIYATIELNALTHGYIFYNYTIHRYGLTPFYAN